jgi:hypothetical protein
MNERTNELHKSIKAFLKRAIENGQIDKHLANLLTQNKPKIACFYGHTKIHKVTTPTADDTNEHLQTCPPLRPILASNRSLTEPLSILCDVLLRPIVEGLDSYIRDAKHLLQKVEQLNKQGVPEDAILVKMDVKSLYTNINQDDGIRACVEHYIEGTKENQEKSEKLPSALILDELLNHILKGNYFKSREQFFLQIWGTAMVY